MTQLNQEIKPIRQILVRHTGEEAEKQKAVVDNYDQVIDIRKRDLDGAERNWSSNNLGHKHFNCCQIWTFANLGCHMDWYAFFTRFHSPSQYFTVA